MGASRPRGLPSSRSTGISRLVGWMEPGPGVAGKEAGSREAAGWREVARTVVCGRVRRRVVTARPIPGGEGGVRGGVG